jgi:hypothetical protein
VAQAVAHFRLKLLAIELELILRDLKKEGLGASAAGASPSGPDDPTGALIWPLRKA